MRTERAFVVLTLGLVLVLMLSLDSLEERAGHSLTDGGQLVTTSVVVSSTVMIGTTVALVL